MFTADHRDLLRSLLLERAREDPLVNAAALFGSAAVNQEDAWSDIDVALGLSASASWTEVVGDWTEYLYEHHGATHHLDVPVGDARYRVFLLPHAIQVDLSFWPAGGMIPMGPKFRLIFGTAADPHTPEPKSAEARIGMAWLYVLHARSSIGRGRFWQADYMINGSRSEILALACARLGLPAHDGRGFDELPTVVLHAARAAFPAALTETALSDALAATVAMLIDETARLDEQLAARLRDTLAELLVW